MSGAPQPSPIIRPRPATLRDALARATEHGATHLTIEADVALRVDAVNQDGRHEAATRLLAPYVRYLCACLSANSGQTITIQDARRMLGFDCTGEPQTSIGRRRVELMERLGWPAETLTMEQLEDRVGAL